MKKFIITTLGCKVNQYESEVIANDLIHAGWTMANGDEPADLCIINTCTVTQKAAMQCRQAIRQAIRSNPNAQIIVTGCYARTEPDEIRKIKGVQVETGNWKLETGNWKLEIRNWKLEIGNPVIQQSVSNFKSQISNFKTRPFLKIQDGCNAFCTYCIVPYARGRSRSMPPENVLEHIRQFKRLGYREIVLSGIHLGIYGTDLSPATNLFELLQLIQDAKPIDRIRLSSIEPNELTEEIIELVAASDIFCPHFHIPLQSGDDMILKRMHRPYTNKLFRDLINKIHDLIPDAAIGVDTLIGFPGETDAAFENTYRTIQELPVTYLHVFPFSSRKGTPASTYPDKVPTDVIKARTKKMRELGMVKKNAFYKKFVGKNLEVLVESKRDNVSGLLKGFTQNYIPVFIEGDDNLKNTLVNVKLDYKAMLCDP